MDNSERLNLVLNMNPEEASKYLIIEDNNKLFTDNNELIGITTIDSLSRLYYAIRTDDYFTRLIFQWDNDKWQQENKISK